MMPQTMDPFVKSRRSNLLNPYPRNWAAERRREQL